jgi:hypothetical protein
VVEREPEIHLKVVVDSNRFDAVVQALVDAGAVIEEEWRTIGTVLCRVASDRAADIGAVDGVLAEPERTDVHVIQGRPLARSGVRAQRGFNAPGGSK